MPGGRVSLFVTCIVDQAFPSTGLAMAGILERLGDLLEVGGIDEVGAGFDGVVTYHDSCHALRELAIHNGPRRLLSRVRGLELREMDAASECCGFGGTFSVKFPEVSGGMARTKIDSILKAQADTVVSIDSSCLMQLQGVISRAGLPIRTMHLAEVLASR